MRAALEEVEILVPMVSSTTATTPMEVDEGWEIRSNGARELEVSMIVKKKKKRKQKKRSQFHHF